MFRVITTVFVISVIVLLVVLGIIFRRPVMDLCGRVWKWLTRVNHKSDKLCLSVGTKLVERYSKKVYEREEAMLD